jgi:hypothetical protein
MKRTLIATGVALAASFGMAQAASAQDGGQVLQADLAAQNGSTATATATVTVEGDNMTVDIQGSGFTPGESPHAQHIHGVVGQDATCPTEAQDADGDGIVTTSEGQATYGPILVSLTTEGDTTADSGLAVDRMPVADAAGNLSYNRTFALPAGLGPNIDALHIVQHGVVFDGSGAYDGDRMSDLDPTLPAEATDPANCGELVAMPSGGVQTGGGGMAHDHSAMVAAAAADAGTGSGSGSGAPLGLIGVTAAAVAALAVGGGAVVLRHRAA